MNLKKKLKRFFTLRRRADDGFTLVELIVVIAIMAILAGVGSAGYAGYIKSANKNADKVLVGNIMRAIETGTYSTMFVPPEPLSVGVTTYPVGFVSLNTEGCTVLTSASTEKEVSGECEFVYNENITYVVPKNVILTCASNSAHKSVGTTYTLKTETVTYCKTHSVNLPHTLTAANSNSYATSYTYDKKNFVHLAHTTTATAYLTIPAGTLFIEDINDLYKPSSDGVCVKAANPGLNVSAEPATDGILYDAIYAAFGEEELALKYDGWVSDEGASFATFYTYAPQVFDNVADQTKLLIDATNSETINGLATAAGINLNSYLTEGKYDSSAQLLDSFSGFVSEKMTEQEWDAVWKAAESSSDEYDFTLPSHGAKNDYIWAARMAYNSSFASYCSASNISDTYTDLIVNYGEDELGGMLHIPSVVNHDAFAKSGEGSLKQSFIDADATNGEAIYETCKNLYNSYVSSNVAAENGKVFYSTVETLNQTGSVAMDPNNGYEDYFAYYNSYLSEMANLYNAAQTAADGGLLIIVSMEDGIVKCDVSPSAANPRND